MAKFAPVAPPRIVAKLKPINSGDYHLLLAHDVAANSVEYRRFFDNFRSTIIMDNSVIELGGAVDLKVVKNACNVVDPMSIVLPDILLDARATVESCKAALEPWTEAFTDIFGKRADRGFMIVPQGRTIQEWCWCAEQFADVPKVNFWGIPRNLVAACGTRDEAISIARALNPNRRIHLLGFSDNIVDDVICCCRREVEGIDSAVPLRAASLGKEMSFDLDMPPRHDWWDTVEFIPEMDKNIEKYRGWIRRN